MLINDEKCLMFDELHWWHRQVGAAPWEDFFIGGAHPAPSINFLGENPRSNLYWLYLPMDML
jgi:hypothetical protein